MTTEVAMPRSANRGRIASPQAFAAALVAEYVDACGNGVIADMELINVTWPARRGSIAAGAASIT
jgi:hypothetical protein